MIEWLAGDHDFLGLCRAEECSPHDVYPRMFAFFFSLVAVGLRYSHTKESFSNLLTCLLTYSHCHFCFQKALCLVLKTTLKAY